MQTRTLDAAPASVQNAPPAPDDADARILAAAAEVIGAYGFRKTSMEDVARRAGVSRVTLYRRFADKDALVNAVVLREVRRSLAAIVTDLETLAAPEDQFVRGFVATVLVARRHPLFQRLVTGEAGLDLAKYASVTWPQTIDLGRAMMSGVIAGLQAQGKFTGLDAAALAETLIRLWHSLVMTPSSAVDSDDEASVTRFARDVLFPLLFRRA